jgi:hypothetical protein
MVCGVRRALEEKARDVAKTVLCVVSSIRASCVHEGEAAARDTSDLTALLHDIGRSFESLLSQQAFDCAALVSSLTTTRSTMSNPPTQLPEQRAMPTLRKRQGIKASSPRQDSWREVANGHCGYTVPDGWSPDSPCRGNCISLTGVITRANVTKPISENTTVHGK